MKAKSEESVGKEGRKGNAKNGTDTSDDEDSKELKEKEREMMILLKVPLYIFDCLIVEKKSDSPFFYFS